MRIVSLFVLAILLAGPAARAADALPATAYFPVLPFDAPPDAPPRWVPVAVNQPINGVHRGVTRAIIVIHNETRDANAILATMSGLAGSANQTTMIMAPQFLLASDIARFADRLPERGRAFAAWSFAGWAVGDDSVAIPVQKSISSFTVIDLLLMYLSDRTLYPDLRTVTLAGFGTGAAFAQRYAALGSAADIVMRQDIDLRFLVAAAPSYLYLTPSRPMGGRQGFRVPDLAACPEYNAYPYGLDKLNPYARHTGGNAAKIGYATRFITYLNGGGEDGIPETNCAVLAQGNDSAARAANYAQYLQSLYGDLATRTQVFIRPPDAYNDAVGLFGSVCGMNVLFGDGLCAHTFGGRP